MSGCPDGVAGAPAAVSGGSDLQVPGRGGGGAMTVVLVPIVTECGPGAEVAR